MPGSGHQRILVVEDEANIASFVAMYLKKAGFDVSVARNGAEALMKAGTESPTREQLDVLGARVAVLGPLEQADQHEQPGV